MRRSTFSDEEITRFVRDIESGRPIEEICRISGVSPRTLYRWRRQFGGLKPFAVQKLRSLEQENLRLRIEAACRAEAAGPVCSPQSLHPFGRSDVGGGTAAGGLARPSVVGRFAALRLR